MRVVVRFAACLCLLPHAVSSQIEQEVDGDDHLSLLQQTVAIRKIEKGTQPAPDANMLKDENGMMNMMTEMMHKIDNLAIDMSTVKELLKAEDKVDAQSPDPSAPVATQPDPSVTVATQPDPSVAVATQPDASVAVATQSDPSMPVATQPDEAMPVAMKPEEEELFNKYLAASTSYLEFGAGGSTVKALTYPNLYSIQVIESDARWVEKLKERSDIAEAIETHRLQLHLVDIGPTIEWGFPASTGADYGKPIIPDHQLQELEAKFANYYNLMDIDTLNLDFVLVDGRFRVECFLQVLKNAAPDITIAVHDYVRHNTNAGTQLYATVEKYADKVDEAGTLVIFKPKANIDMDDLERDISMYKVVPAM